MHISTHKKALALSALALVGIGSTQAQNVKKATSGIVISKVFNAGTTQAGSSRNYTGGEEYIELYNNTATALNIAGCYIGLVESESGTGAYTAGTITDPANGVALKQLYQIPGDEVVIQPWSAITIAAAAIDHSTAAENGPDLSKADFEFGGETNDNADVPNLTQIFTFNSSITKVNLTNGGDCSILLFPASFSSRIDTENNVVYPNGKTSGSQYLKVNSYYAMDGVEILKTKKDGDDYVVDATRKRLPDSKDSTYVDPHQKMNKDGYIAYRKTALNFDGNKYLYDTGSSLRDFEVSNTIKPKDYDDTPSGVTDITVTIPESGYLAYNADKPFFTDKGVFDTRVSISNRNTTAVGNASFTSLRGDSLIFSSGAHLLVGAPGDHTLHLSDAVRMISTSSLNWLSDDNDNLADGVFTVTTRNRYPLRFINEKGNVRFEADNDGDNKQTMKFNADTDERLYINVLNTTTTTVPVLGITPDEAAATGIKNIIVKKQTNVNDDAVYNLQGVRMDSRNLPKGIYIKEGKKFVVK